MMIKEWSGAEDVGRGYEFALMVPEYWKKEIEEAIDKVKRGVFKRGHKWHRRRQRRGYWTPVGFAWFGRRRKWRKYKRRASS